MPTKAKIKRLDRLLDTSPPGPEAVACWLAEAERSNPNLYEELNKSKVLKVGTRYPLQPPTDPIASFYISDEFLTTVPSKKTLLEYFHVIRLKIAPKGRPPLEIGDNIARRKLYTQAYREIDPRATHSFFGAYYRAVVKDGMEPVDTDMVFRLDGDFYQFFVKDLRLLYRMILAIWKHLRLTDAEEGGKPQSPSQGQEPPARPVAVINPTKVAKIDQSIMAIDFNARKLALTEYLDMFEMEAGKFYWDFPGAGSITIKVHCNPEADMFPLFYVSGRFSAVAKMIMNHLQAFPSPAGKPLQLENKQFVNCHLQDIQDVLSLYEHYVEVRDRDGLLKDPPLYIRRGAHCIWNLRSIYELEMVTRTVVYDSTWETDYETDSSITQDRMDNHPEEVARIGITGKSREEAKGPSRDSNYVEKEKAAMSRPKSPLATAKTPTSKIPATVAPTISKRQLSPVRIPVTSAPKRAQPHTHSDLSIPTKRSSPSLPSPAEVTLDPTGCNLSLPSPADSSAIVGGKLLTMIPVPSQAKRPAGVHT